MEESLEIIGVNRQASPAHYEHIEILFIPDLIKEVPKSHAFPKSRYTEIL